MLVDENYIRGKAAFFMENIILQIVQKTAKNFMEYYEAKGIHDLAGMAEGFKTISDEMARDVLGAFVSAADDVIRSAREERMGDKIKIRESNVPRILLTALGEFSYKRTYYDTPDGREYIVDNMLGVYAYERIDQGISAKLVNHAAVHSYEKSAEIVTGGQISRQSVRNKAMNTGEVLYMPERSAAAPESIHIFADEAHVNLQSGKNTILPLITVCAGKQKVCKGRNELIEPFHVHGYKLKPEEHWEYVYALCAEKYDMSLVKEVYIYGDGASWIKSAFDVFAEAVHVLDEFHFKKRLRNLLAGKICSAFNLIVGTSIKANDKRTFDKTVQDMLTAIEEKMPVLEERDKKIKSVKEHAAYILNHWEAIQNRKLPGAIGSCTEAMISHALAQRFSRSPMGWSEAGLSKLAMIRVFVLNGCNIKPADTLAWKQNDGKRSAITTFEKYGSLVKKQQDTILKGAKNWRWFEVDELISGKITGTKVALDALGRIRNIS
jgi:hypothetical protein